MREPSRRRTPEAAAAPKTNPAAPATSATAETEGVVYVCPMPEHVSITYDHPGKCPICGMTLVPVTRGELKRLQPGGKVLYYTCPMPEHSQCARGQTGQMPDLRHDADSRDGSTAVSAQPTEGTAVSADSKLPTLYTCPMHLDVVSDKPGKCPKCEMDLVPTRTLENGKIAEEYWRKEHPPAQ